MDRPSFQFYPEAWLADMALRACSSAARGLWIDLICLMHQGQPYGHLRLRDSNGGYFIPTAIRLARMTGNDQQEVDSCLQELEECGVIGRTDEGVIYSKKMVRDENQRQKWKTQRANRAHAREQTPSTHATRSAESTLSPSPSPSPTPNEEKEATARDDKDAWFEPDGTPRISEAFEEELRKEYAEVDFATTWRNLSQWHKAAPPSKRKKNARRFIVNWFTGDAHNARFNKARGSPREQDAQTWVEREQATYESQRTELTPEQEEAYRKSGERRAAYEREQLEKRKAERAKK